MVPFPNDPLSCRYCARTTTAAYYYNSTATTTTSCGCQYGAPRIYSVETTTVSNYPRLNHEARRKERAQKPRKRNNAPARGRALVSKESPRGPQPQRKWLRALQHFRS